MSMKPPATQTSTTAVLSLVFGIVCWFALPVLGAIIAVVCGHMARAEIRRAPTGTVEGDGVALSGMILGYVHLALGALIICGVALVLLGVVAYHH
jgi:hypothetical protein